MTTPTAMAWTAEQLAGELHGRRDRLLAELPRVVRAARYITRDERELVLDEAIEFIALEYTVAIRDIDELELVLWTVCRHRTLNAMHGRPGTAIVRYGYARVSEDELAELADSAQPDIEAERTVERDLVAEFAATLSVAESDVLRVKYLSGTADPVGWRRIAHLLSIAPGRARALERSITTKLDDFAAQIAAGELCGRREALLAAHATGGATDLQARIAHAHLRHCTACKTSYKAELRHLRGVEFGRQVASILPLGPAVTGGDQHGRVHDVLVDWAARLLGHDPAAASQLVAGGAGRGAGSVIAVKIAACLAAGAATVGACVATGVIDLTNTTPTPAPRRAAPAKTATPAPTRRARRTATPAPTRTPRPTATPRPTVTAKAHAKRTAKRRASAQTQGGTSPSSHEQAPASPAPAGSRPNGASEFEPGPVNSPRAPAAPVPAAPGAQEFGP